MSLNIKSKQIYLDITINYVEKYFLNIRGINND